MSPESRFVPAEAMKSAPPKRHDIGPKLMRETTRAMVDTFLKKRAQWMLDHVGLLPIMEKKVWPDNTEARRVQVLCLGAGKGHEMEAIHDALPNSIVMGVDPHDHYAPPVWERVKESAKDLFYLHESVSAEDLREIDSDSQDAVTLFFVLHHVDKAHHEHIFSEARRVLKQDGYLFVAEDLVADEQEQRVTEQVDRRMNLEIADGPHEYRNTDEWKMFFAEHGFEVEQEKEIKPDKVRHGFFALKRKESAVSSLEK